MENFNFSLDFFNFGVTFDDVLLLPGYTDFERSEIDLETNLTKKIKIKIPLVSSPMDTVTEHKLAIALGKLGGIGIIHRNLTIKQQVEEVLKVKEKKLLIGAAIGVSQGWKERLKALIKAGVDVIVVDSAHGFAKKIIEAVKYIKSNFSIEVIAGNVATSEAALALIKAGVDGLRVGMGPGAICTTRVISGMGVPQLTAIKLVNKISSKYKVPIIADGGIRYSGDMVKALAAGASSLMMGNYFAASLESAGRIIKLKKELVPKRFQNILKKGQKIYLFKEYRGMGSISAMKRGAKIKAEDEFHGKNYKDRVFVAEGVEGLVPLKGTLKELVEQAIGGIKSGLYYVGAKNIKELWQKARFIPISQSSLIESHPHDLFIINSGKNYQ